MLNQLKAPPGANRKRKRVGRGRSGKGKMSGRGHKGQLGRRGAKVPAAFEGGQMPMMRRLPKTGFKNPHRIDFAEINVGDFEAHFEAGATVDLGGLMERRLVQKKLEGLKVLGHGELKIKLTVKAKKFSKAAKEKIEAAGGVAEVI